MLKLCRLQTGAQPDDISFLSKEGMELLWGAGVTYSVDKRGRITTVTDSNGLSYDVVQTSDASYSCCNNLEVSSYEYGSQIEQGDYGLFKFLADHTDVEWGAMYSGKDKKPADSTICFLQTSHNNDILHMNYDADAGYGTFVHSHPAYTN